MFLNSERITALGVFVKKALVLVLGFALTWGLTQAIYRFRQAGPDVATTATKKADLEKLLDRGVKVTSLVEEGKKEIRVIDGKVASLELERSQLLERRAGIQQFVQENTMLARVLGDLSNLPKDREARDRVRHVASVIMDLSKDMKDPFAIITSVGSELVLRIDAEKMFWNNEGESAQFRASMVQKMDTMVSRLGSDQVLNRVTVYQNEGDVGGVSKLRLRALKEYLLNHYDGNVAQIEVRSVGRGSLPANVNFIVDMAILDGGKAPAEKKTSEKMKTNADGQTVSARGQVGSGAREVKDVSVHFPILIEGVSRTGADHAGEELLSDRVSDAADGNIRL